MAQQHILQVSELTKKVKFMLESELNTVWLCGEISNFIAASSGHWYLSLKDSKSQVKCAMFKGSNRRVKLASQLTPRNGQQVLVRAKVSLYEPRGDFQLIIEHMEDEGDGLLRQQFEQLKHKLNAQGIFAKQYKQSIPTHINRVGIITSSTGAAVKDILSVLKRRNSTINAIIYPVLVQGEQAKAEIVKAIDVANQRDECDVLIVGRGGGSLEDLWSFNEEQVVEAIFHSRIPIISAVGHEIDTTLADYVADVRAPTPSAAAEIVSNDISEQVNKLSQYISRIQQLATHKLSFKSQQYLGLVARLKQLHPKQNIQSHQQRADELSFRLEQSMQRTLKMAAIKPQQLSSRLNHLSPHKMITNQQVYQQQLHKKLLNYMTQHLAHKQQMFVHFVEQLQLMSPLATIVRGYGVVKNSENQVVSSVKQVQRDEQINIQIKDGIIAAKVTNIRKNDS